MNDHKHSNLGKIFIIFVVFFLGTTSAYGAKGFIVEKSGENKILITDGYSEYIIEHSYDCYDSEFIEGTTIFIDSYISPMYGDTIIISGGFSKSTCEVTSSEKVNIKRYYVDKVIDSDDKIIVSDRNSVQYLLEYGIGCGLSMWRYEGKIVDIDIGGSFLDGIGDRMYLFDSGRDCKIWDGEEIGNNTSSHSNLSDTSGYTPPMSRNTCPLNSHISSSNAIKCTCNIGYQTNSTKDACVPIPVPVCQKDIAFLNDETGACVCRYGVGTSGQCQTQLEKCISEVGEHNDCKLSSSGSPIAGCEKGYKLTVFGKCAVNDSVSTPPTEANTQNIPNLSLQPVLTPPTVSPSSVSGLHTTKNKTSSQKPTIKKSTGSLNSIVQPMQSLSIPNSIVLKNDNEQINKMKSNLESNTSTQKNSESIKKIPWYKKLFSWF